jgi:hypothetical protein
MATSQRWNLCKKRQLSPLFSLPRTQGFRLLEKRKISALICCTTLLWVDDCFEGARVFAEGARYDSGSLVFKPWSKLKERVALLSIPKSTRIPHMFSTLFIFSHYTCDILVSFLFYLLVVFVFSSYVNGVPFLQVLWGPFFFCKFLFILVMTNLLCSELKGFYFRFIINKFVMCIICTRKILESAMFVQWKLCCLNVLYNLLLF